MVTATGGNLVFVLGVPRSGTTLLSVLLGGHPDVLCPPEPWLMLAVESLGRVAGAHPADAGLIGTSVREFMVGGTAVEAARAAAVAAYNAWLARWPRKRVFADKTPRYYLILDYLAGLFPDARFLWLRRNPLDVAASYRSTWATNLAELVVKEQGHPHVMDLVAGTRRLAGFAGRHADRVWPVRYEDIVSDVEREMGKIADFVGISAPNRGWSHFDPAAVGLTRSFAGDKKILGTSTPHSKSVGAWKRAFTAEELGQLRAALGDQLLRELGYEGVVGELEAMGVAGGGPEGERRAAELAKEVEAQLARRVAEIVLPSSEGFDLVQAEHESIGHGLVTTDQLIVAVKRKVDERAAALSAAEEAARGAAEAAARQAAEGVAAAAELQAARAEAARTREELVRAEGRATSAEEAATEAAEAAEELRSALAEHAREAGRLNTELGEARAEIGRLGGELREVRTRADGLFAELKRRNALEAERERRSLSARLKRFFRTFTWQGAQDAFEAWVRRKYVGLPDMTPGPAPVWPRITVVTPVMNAAETIAETIESVLRQGYPNLEYIIVDGGSTDGTMDVIDRCKDRITKVIAGPDRGMYDAIAKGFEASSGEILGYLNADDLLETGALRRIADHFRANPDHAVIYHEDIVQVDGWRFPNAGQPRVNTIRLLNGHTLYQDGVWFRREAYFWSGGMNRDLKVAGDYDLWLRMSRMFPLNRVDGHVSCFRMRAGQLSQDVDRYRAEQEVVRRAFLTNFGLPGRVRCRLLWAKDLALGLAGRVVRGRRRLFFPIDFKGLPPPPGEPPKAPLDGPCCPLTGRTADRLLLSARDTRFADNRINYLYYCSSSGVAVTYPPIGREHLNELYEKYYSDPHPRVIHPDQRYGSPYRQWKGTRRAARVWTYVRLVGRVLDRGKSDPRLEDQTVHEVFKVLRGIVPRRGGKVRFLDVGCFDGRLLGAIRRATNWEACGLEANEHGVRAAREAGHRVWQAYAEDAPVVVPDGILFDVIFLGQTIEHLARPLETIRRLRQMLAPGGVLVVSTPNLDSAQIDRFGPTWAHWHLPYHRAIYSRRGLARAAELAGMRVLRMRTFSHPRWTFMSLILNELGTGSSVPHGLEVPDDWRRRSLALWTWGRLFWDWRGRGDYVYAVMGNV